MSKRFNAQRRAQFLIALITGVALLLLCYLWLGFFNSYMQSSKEIYRFQPLMARLVGIEKAEAQLLAANDQAESDIQRFVFPDQGGADVAAAALQQKVRNLAVEQGFTVSGSQILPSSEGDGFQRLSINMTLNGPMSSLVGMLDSFALLEPTVAISTAQLSPGRSRSNEQRVNMRITLQALRWRS